MCSLFSSSMTGFVFPIGAPRSCSFLHITYLSCNDAWIYVIVLSTLAEPQDSMFPKDKDSDFIHSNIVA